MMTKLESDIIEELEMISIKAKDWSYTQLKTYIYRLLPNFLINTQTTDKIRRPKEDGYYRDPSLIFRARPDQITRKGHAIQDPYLQLKDISIVPPNSYHTIPTGRCNLTESPIFYSSNYPVTACLEAASNGFTHETGSVTATMGAWKICQTLNLAELSFSVKTLKHLETIGKVTYQDIEKYRTGMYHHIRSQLEMDSRRPYSADFQIAVLDFFSDHFGKTEIHSGSDYYLSNLYCDAVFNHSVADETGSLYDGILYPSVRNALQEFNLALHPRAMSKIKFIGAEHIWITTYPGGQLQMDSLDRASLGENGMLIWQILQNQSNSSNNRNDE